MKTKFYLLDYSHLLTLAWFGESRERDSHDALFISIATCVDLQTVYLRYWLLFHHKYISLSLFFILRDFSVFLRASLIFWNVAVSCSVKTCLSLLIHATSVDFICMLFVLYNLRSHLVSSRWSFARSYLPWVTDANTGRDVYEIWCTCTYKARFDNIPDANNYQIKTVWCTFEMLLEKNKNEKKKNIQAINTKK